jgi:galactose mutarotase-like enzyme
MTDTKTSILTIRSESAAVAIRPEQGGTVTSFIVKGPEGEEREVLWQRPSAHSAAGAWPDGGIPVLFPFAGRVWDRGELGRYRVRGQSYPMGIHGFLYSLSPKTVAVAQDAVSLGFTHDEFTCAVFPWEYSLESTYKLTGQTLALTFVVTNHGATTPGGAKMPVALGLHPYFRLASRLNMQKQGFALSLPRQRAFRVTPQGGQGESFLNVGHERIDLTRNEFHNTIFELGAGKIEAALVEGERIQMIREEPFGYLVLWGKAEEDFFCIEPWMAPPDAPNQSLGTRWLAPGESLTARVQIAVIPSSQE